jgi:hypothetical protein
MAKACAVINLVEDKQHMFRNLVLLRPCWRWLRWLRPRNGARGFAWSTI